MLRNRSIISLRPAVTTAVLLAAILWGGTRIDVPAPALGGEPAASDDPLDVPATLEEARGRARLLHETIHATLQIVHLQYYREDEGLIIPARTLKAVFDEVARARKVQMHWLVVNAKAMNIDHNPRDEFERNAAHSLASGKREVDLLDHGVYRYAGAITLSSECLKCHLPNRTSTQDRAAGLVITMPVRVAVGGGQ